MTDKKLSRPPLGIKPRHIHDRERLEEIDGAITRFIEATYPIPIEWIKERNEILNNLEV